MYSLFWLLVLGAFFIGTIVLQIYLSKRESKLPGLVLPLLTFLMAVVVTVEVILAGTIYAEKEMPEAVVLNEAAVPNEGAVVPDEEAAVLNEGDEEAAIPNRGDEQTVIPNEEGVDGISLAGADSNDDTTYLIEDNNSSIRGGAGDGEGATGFSPAGEETGGDSMKSGGVTRILLAGLAVFFLYNIPTLLYGGIYIFFRKRKKTAERWKNSAVDKMKIQDL